MEKMMTDTPDILDGNVSGIDSRVLNYELCEIETIDEGPFSAIRSDDKWFLALGKYRISELKDSKAEVLKDSEDMGWLRFMQVMSIVAKEERIMEREEKDAVK